MINLEKVLHTGASRVAGGRDGYASSPDGRLDIRLTPPGAPGAGTNPEQLLAAGWSACFLGALRHACNARRLACPATAAVCTEVDLVHAERGFFLRARLLVSLPGVEPELAGALIDAAREACPYSKAMRGTVRVDFLLD
ncbi:Ohr family peroxiredoxin [Stenotrophomonas rhizophila]|jgi:Ohr subfamily peroxiredoxin|uniref:Ohr family peroxiredoxin n=1 Tax=Stenotrophomonas rhizophila TaxID=216778 RepID=UPI0011A3A12B|nr:Ohr family peroxiredoxin [Stenotrophomonas rhizophila]